MALKHSLIYSVRLFSDIPTVCEESQLPDLLPGRGSRRSLSASGDWHQLLKGEQWAGASWSRPILQWHGTWIWRTNQWISSLSLSVVVAVVGVNRQHRMDQGDRRWSMFNLKGCESIIHLNLLIMNLPWGNCLGPFVSSVWSLFSSWLHCRGLKPPNVSGICALGALLVVPFNLEHLSLPWSGCVFLILYQDALFQGWASAC